jgi:hypothetical protein
MSDTVKDIISIFVELQNEYISLYEKNNIDKIEIDKFKDIQKDKLFNFKIKLLEYKSNINSTYIKKEIDSSFKENLIWWDSNFGK